MKPKLFLLKAPFPDAKAGPGLYYCPHCAAVEGVLTYAPELREKLDVRHVDFPRPRQEIIAEIGEAHQGCPVLVLPPDWPKVPSYCQKANGRAFLVGSEPIIRFFSDWAGTPRPHP